MEKNKTALCAIGLVGAVLASSSAFGGARANLVHWWRFKDLNSDGLLQPGEVYDVMTAGTETPLVATGIKQCTDTTEEPTATPIFFTNTLYSATMRTNLENNVVFTNPKKSADSRMVNIQSITLPDAAAVTNEEATVAARFVWFGHRTPRSSDNKYVQPAIIYSNGLKGNKGWALAMGYYQLNPGTGNLNALPGFCFGNNNLYFDYKTSTTDGNRTYDATMPALKDSTPVNYEYAASFRRNPSGQVTVTVFFRRYPDSSTYPYPVFCTNVVNLASTDLSDIGEISIGHNGSSSFADLAGGDNSFAGIINDVRVYDKAMGPEDLEGLFCDPFDTVVGSANGNADEFGASGAASPYNADTAEWRQMPARLDATHRSVQVNLSVENYGHMLGRLLHVSARHENGSSGCRVKVLFNGKRIGNKCVRQDGGELVFWISPELMSTISKDSTTGRYPFSITLERADEEPGAVLLDSIAIDGAWQIGNPSNDSEIFGGQSNYNYVYHVGQHNVKQMAKCIGGGGLLDKMHFRFEVSDWAAQNLAHKLYIHSYGASNDELTLKLNGTTFTTIAVGAPVNGFTLDIPAGTLLGGVNRMQISKPTSSNWINWRCWRFSTVGDGVENYDPTGLTILLK